MADTGAPYFIPYVEPTDLVRDYPAADEASADAIAAALDAAGNAGIGSNVVQTVKTDTFTTTSTSFADVTGLSLAITPTSATSKLLIGWSVIVGGGVARGGQGVITDGAGTVLVQGDASGSRTRATFGSRIMLDVDATFNMSGEFLYSPASADPQTIKIRVRTNDGAQAFTVNRSQFSFNDAFEGVYASFLTAIEVAA